MPSTQQSVPVVVLFDYLLSDTGAGLSGQKVTVVLNSTTPATSISPPTVIAQVQQTTTTDGNGYWQFSLVPNTNINPANTTYTVLTPAGTYDVTLGSAGPYQSTAVGTIVNVPVPLAPAPSGPVTIGSTLTVAGLLSANGGEVIAGGTGATLNASGDLAVRSVTASSGSGPYLPNLPGAPTIPTPAGVMTGKMWDWGGFSYNPRAANAKGDGVTDDAAAWRTAIQAGGVGRTGVGSRVEGSPGTYIINSTLSLVDAIRNVLIDGAGMGACFLIPGSGLGGNPMFLAGAASMGQITIQNLTIANLAEPGAIAGQHGISIPQNQRTVAIRAVEIYFMGADAINHGGNSSVCRLQDNWIHDNYRGWGFNGTGATAPLQNIVIDGNSFYANGGGVRIASSFGVTLANNDIEGGGTVLPSNPMVSITGNSVWCYNNTCGLVTGSTATDCVLLNAQNITWIGGSANVHDSARNCMHLGSSASRTLLQNPAVNGSNIANQTGILADAGATDCVISGPVYGTGANALTANLTDNGTRTELADTQVQFPSTDGYYHFGTTGKGIVNDGGDLDIRAKAGSTWTFHDGNGTLKATLDATGNFTPVGYVSASKLYTGAAAASGSIIGGTANLFLRNNADSATNVGISNAGDVTILRGGAFWGHAAVAAQPAAPVVLADVIAIIRGCGLSA